MAITKRNKTMATQKHRDRVLKDKLDLLLKNDNEILRLLTKIDKQTRATRKAKPKALDIPADLAVPETREEVQ